MAERQRGNKDREKYKQIKRVWKTQTETKRDRKRQKGTERDRKRQKETEKERKGGKNVTSMSMSIRNKKEKKTCLIIYIKIVLLY